MDELKEKQETEKKSAGEFGGWDLFFISCLRVGVSRREKKLGDCEGLIMYWPLKAPTQLPQYNDVTREMRRGKNENLQSGF